MHNTLTRHPCLKRSRHLPPPEAVTPRSSRSAAVNPPLGPPDCGAASPTRTPPSEAIAGPPPSTGSNGRPSVPSAVARPRVRGLRVQAARGSELVKGRWCRAAPQPTLRGHDGAHDAGTNGAPRSSWQGRHSSSSFRRSPGGSEPGRRGAGASRGAAASALGPREPSPAGPRVSRHRSPSRGDSVYYRCPGRWSFSEASRPQ